MTDHQVGGHLARLSPVPGDDGRDAIVLLPEGARDHTSGRVSGDADVICVELPSEGIVVGEQPVEDRAGLRAGGRGVGRVERHHHVSRFGERLRRPPMELLVTEPAVKNDHRRIRRLEGAQSAGHVRARSGRARPVELGGEPCDRHRLKSEAHAVVPRRFAVSVVRDSREGQCGDRMQGLIEVSLLGAVHVAGVSHRPLQRARLRLRRRRNRPARRHREGRCPLPSRRPR